jgi:hypothetical protein
MRRRIGQAAREPANNSSSSPIYSSASSTSEDSKNEAGILDKRVNDGSPNRQVDDKAVKSGDSAMGKGNNSSSAPYYSSTSSKNEGSRN